MQIPELKDLAVNTDDDSIVGLLSRLLGIPENRTEVALNQPRQLDANVKPRSSLQKQGWSPIGPAFFRENEPAQVGCVLWRLLPRPFEWNVETGD